MLKAVLTVMMICCGLLLAVVALAAFETFHQNGPDDGAASDAPDPDGPIPEP